jgi:hypothetical protein
VSRCSELSYETAHCRSEGCGQNAKQRRTRTSRQESWKRSLLLAHGISSYEFQDFTYRQRISEGFFLESYRSQVRGQPIEATVWVHYNDKDEADSVVISHRPLRAALLFSYLMWQQFGDRFGDLFIDDAEAKSLGLA